MTKKRSVFDDLFGARPDGGADDASDDEFDDEPDDAFDEFDDEPDDAFDEFDDEPDDAFDEFDDELDENPMAGLLPALGSEAECECGCGERVPVHDLPLPAYRPVSLEGAAVEARASTMARAAVALASWALGRPATGLGALLMDDDVDAAAGVLSGVDDRLRGALEGSDDPAEIVEPFWDAAIEGMLLSVGADGTRVPGPGLTGWQRDDLEPVARLALWMSMLAGYLGAIADRDEDVLGGDDDEAARIAEIAGQLPVLLYGLGDQATTVGTLAAALLPPDEAYLPDGAEDDTDTDADVDADAEAGLAGVSRLLDLPPLVEAVAEAVDRWAVAGVLELVEADELVDRNPFAELEQLLGTLVDDPDPTAREAVDAVRQAATAGQRGPAVQVTPLGRLSLVQLLEAHGFEIPKLGALGQVQPAELLDHLGGYDLADVADEVTLWLDRHGDGWEAALREVAVTATGRGPQGSSRRATLPDVLAAAGPRVEPLLAVLGAEPMLRVVVADTRHLIGTGAEPAVREQLWDAVDLLDAPRGSGLPDFAGLVHGVGLPDLLREVLDDLGDDAGLLTTIDHPGARDVFWAALPHLGDAELARRLKRVLGAGAPARSDHRRQPSARGRRSGRRR